MITIKAIDNNNAELKVSKGTPHTTMLLGIEMLIETLIKDSSANLNIDDLLADLKTMYERDKEGQNMKVIEENKKIIEEEKEIHELDVQADEVTPNNFYITNKTDTKCYLTKHSKIMADKINELVREINKLKNK